uniref:Uncharacterized protein n=1 Tax=Anguilla anguilla TaxID=7936 RepID=A0A0E9WEV5_ANGAN
MKPIKTAQSRSGGLINYLSQFYRINHIKTLTTVATNPDCLNVLAFHGTPKTYQSVHEKRGRGSPQP